MCFDAYLIGNGEDMFVSRDIQVKNVIIVLCIQLVSNADERCTTSLWHPVIYNNHVILAVCHNRSVILQRHNYVINPFTADPVNALHFAILV